MKRRSFSIVEILLAIGIIVVVGSALAINFHRSHQERQEKDVVDIVESKLRMAANLAKISNREVRVIFGEDEGKTVIYLSPDIRFSERMKANFSRKTTLAKVQDVQITPESGKVTAVSYFPWGIDNRDTEVHITFQSGRKLTSRPAKYVPNLLIEDQRLVEDLYPREVAEDETEEK